MGRAWLPACFAAVALAGCQSAGSGPSAAPIAAYAAPAGSESGQVGSVPGAVVPNLSADDLAQAYGAEQRALESGRAGVATKWRGRPASGEILVGPLFRINDTDCREYTHVITGGDGQVETARGRACRLPDGGWQPVG